jgi:hypothetical protein
MRGIVCLLLRFGNETDASSAPGGGRRGQEIRFASATVSFHLAVFGARSAGSRFRLRERPSRIV